MRNKIKLALVGFGRIAQRHIDAINKFDKHYELIEICDSNTSVLKGLSDYKTYSSFELLLKESEATYIILTTPNGLHAQQTILAAEKGFNIITEKPMATSVKEAEKMIEACDFNQVALFVVKQVRLLERIKLLKKAVEENHFGNIYLANFNLFWSRPQSFYEEASWRGTKKLDGGMLYNQASHYIDLMDWLLGPIKNVSCFASTLARNIEVEDTAVINIEFESGAKGSFNATTLTYPKNLECSFTILGERGSVKIGGAALDNIEEWNFESKFAEKDVHLDRVNFDHSQFYENLLDFEQGRQHSLSDGREGLKSIKIIEAALSSSSKGIPIKVN